MMKFARRLFFTIIIFQLSVSGCKQPDNLSSTGEIAQPSPRVDITLTSSPSPVAAAHTPTMAPTDSPTVVPTPTLIPYSIPDWFDNAVIYEIFVRSFADSDGDGIGDLMGIVENLDYLESLSIDVIWLMPIYPSPSVHGYDVTDYFAVDPEYGTLEDLQILVEEVHARDIRIILDFVPSHLSNQNPLFEDAYDNLESETAEWFHWTNDVHTSYQGFANLREMPRFNHSNPEVVDYLTDAARYWIDLDEDGDFSDGIDGFRIDNVTFPPREFFYEFRQRIKAINPDFILLGEAWLLEPRTLLRHYEDQFDSLFDFPLYDVLQGHQDINQDGIFAGTRFPIFTLTAQLNVNQQQYPEETTAVFFLNNHDTNRIATEVDSDPARLRMAPAFLAAFPGPVMIYYGEEIGMLGQKGPAPFYDNYRREPFDWYANEEGEHQTTWFMPDDRWNQPNDGISVEEQIFVADSLLSHYQKAFRLRAEREALHSGSFELLEMQTTGQGPWGFARDSENDVIFAVYNFAQETQTAEFVLDRVDGPIVDLLTGEEYQAPDDNSVFTIELSPGAAVWLGSP